MAPAVAGRKELDMKLQTRNSVEFRKPADTPPAPTRETCFLVYYDGGPASVAALREACRHARSGTKIIAVYLEMIPLSESPEQSDCARTMAIQGILAAATVNAATYGASCKTTYRECHVRGPSMVRMAAQHGNAKIFLGIENGEADDLNPFASYVQQLAPANLVLVRA